MTKKKGPLSTLFDRIFQGQATKEEKDRADRWYEQLDVHHDPVFTNVAEEEQVRERMRARLYAHTHKPAGKFLRLPRWGRVAAAILLFSLAAGGYMYWSSHHTPVAIHHIVADKQIRKIWLPDSTSIILNSASSLTWDDNYNAKDRKVVLDGEAFFDVRKNTEHPFIVVTNNLETRVTGTAFTVESYAGESQIKVALIRGKVIVTDTHRPTSQAALSPGQMVDYSRAGGTLQVKPIAIDAPDAWVNGGLTFNDIPLASAITRLAQRYGLHIQHDPQKVKGLNVVASFQSVTWQEALHSILFTHDMKYTVTGDTIYITNN